MKKIVFLLVLVIFASCRTLLNNEQDYKLVTRSLIKKTSDRMIPAFQYFSSIDTIILERKILEEEITKVKTGINGEIIFFKGVPYERIIIYPETPGIIISIDRDGDHRIEYLKVCFWQNTNKYLIYGPADDPDGSFVLLPMDKKKYPGEILLDGKYYDFVSGIYSPLLVKTKEFNLEDKKSVAPGRTIKKKKTSYFYN